MRVAAALVAAVLVLTAAAAALLVVASLHGAILGEKLIGGGLSEGMRRNAAIFAVPLAATTAVLAWFATRTLTIAPTGRIPAGPSNPSAALRALALVSGPIAIAAGLWVSLLAMIYTSAWRRPDPSVPDGDPCCGHPDTWADVAFGTVYALAIGFVAITLIGAGAGLVAACATGRVSALVRRPAAVLSGALGVGLAAAVPASWLLAGLLGGEYP